MVWAVWVVQAALAAGGDDAIPAVTLDEAIARSAVAATVRGAEAAARAAEARVDQAKAGRLPALGVSGSLDVWNGKQTVEFIQSDAPLDCTGLPEPFASLCAGFGEPLVVRDQITASLTAHTAVPLTGQFAIADRVSAARSGANAAEAGGRTARVEAKYQAEDAWFQALQTENQLDIAIAQAHSLEARAETAKVAVAGGAALANDELKAELALARAQQTVIQVRTLRDAARGRLGLWTGSGGTPVRPVGEPDGPPEVPADVGALVDQALAQRADLAALRATIAGADRSAHAASLDRLPQLAAVAAYVHTEGQGAFAEPNAGYVGLNLDWTAFAWGARDAALDGARASADQARAQLAAAEAGVRLEVTTRADALTAAVAAWDVAARSVSQAEDSLRIQDTLHLAGSGTMNDLLDAEAALVEARSRTATALYDAHRAAAALERAVGAGGERR